MREGVDRRRRKAAAPRLLSFSLSQRAKLDSRKHLNANLGLAFFFLSPKQAYKMYNLLHVTDQKPTPHPTGPDRTRL